MIVKEQKHRTKENKMDTLHRANRIDEFTPERETKIDGRIWLQLNIDLDTRTPYSADFYRKLPKIVQYNDCRFYKMSYNTDNMTVSYAESQGRKWSERYQLDWRIS